MCALTTINGAHRVVYESPSCTFIGPPYALQMTATGSFAFEYPTTGPLYSTGPSVLLDVTYNGQELITSGWIAYQLPGPVITAVWVDVDRIFTDGLER